MINDLILKPQNDGDRKRLQCLITLLAAKLFYHAETLKLQFPATESRPGSPVVGLSAPL